jgi:alpha-1,6-rhamnosyltransferase
MIVSVLIPTYNRPQGLARALESLTTQTMPLTDFEVIVINDSGDPYEWTPPPGLSVVCMSQPHSGQSAALNNGLAVAQGNYITVAHDDDLVLPNKLKALSDALDISPANIGAVFGLPRYVNEDGSDRATPPQVFKYARDYPEVTADTVIKHGLWVHGTATMYRKEVLQAVRGWDAELRTAEEYDLHLRMIDEGYSFRPVLTEVVTYTDGGKSVKYRGSVRRTEAMKRIYGKLKNIRGTA